MKHTIKRKRITFITVISLIFNIIFILSICLIVYKKGGINFLINKTNTNKYATSHYIEKTEYDILSNKQNSIIFFGDSLTQFGQWNELLSNKNIVNRGIENDTTDGLLDRITEVTKTKPQKVFIMIGINDLIVGNSTDKIMTNYKDIVNNIKENSPNTKIYIESVLPIDEKMYEKNYPNQRKLNANNIKEIDTKLKKIKGITYIDLYSNFILNNKLDNKYTVDGIHLNGQGYLIWERTIQKYINE